MTAQLFERPPRSPGRILAEAERIDDSEARLARRNALNGLKLRVEEWLAALDRRPVTSGPSKAELQEITDDLTEHLRAISHLPDLRRAA